MLKDIIEVTTKLIEFVDSFEQSGAKKRESIAKYFSRVSESLKEVAKQLKAGELPYSEVAQLKELAEGLPSAIGEEIGQEQAIELSKLLRKSIGENLENLRNNEEAIRLIQESAGKFDGLAFKVAGYPDPKPPLVKPRVVALILLALVGITTWFVPKLPKLIDILNKDNRKTIPDPNVSTTLVPSSQKIVEKLKEVKIIDDIGGNGALIKYLNNSNNQYRNVANKSLELLKNKRLKQSGAGIGKIFCNYVNYAIVSETSCEDKYLPDNPTIDSDKLKNAILDAYNDKNGTEAKSFEDIVEPK